MPMPGNNQRGDVCGMMRCVCCVIVVIIVCVCGNCSSVFVLLFFIRFTPFVVERVNRVRQYVLHTKLFDLFLLLKLIIRIVFFSGQINNLYDV